MACTQLLHDAYGSVRVALGFAEDDTTNLPDAVVGGLPYGEWASRRMASAAALCEGLSCDPDSDDYSLEWAGDVATAVVAYTAALLARGYLAAKGQDRVTSEGLGSLKVTYDKTDWASVATFLEEMARRSLELHCPAAASRLVGGGGEGLPILISADGPGRYLEEDTIEDRLNELNPWVTDGLI